MFVTDFLDTYENPRRKNFINPSCSKHKKIIEIFIFKFLCDDSERFHLSKALKRSVRIKNVVLPNF